MPTLALILGIIIVVALGVAAYALVAPRRPSVVHAGAQSPTLEPPAPPATEWAADADAEFARLPDAARCDLVFAMGALDDERSRGLLERALGDASEPVALAAAHTLATNGRIDTVRAYAIEHPGERARRLLETLALMG